MALILDPYEKHKFETGGMIYLVRGLTSREKIKIMPYIFVGEEVTLDPAAMKEVIELGLVGWEDETPFDEKDNWVNIDKIEFEDFVKICTKIIQLSGVEAEQLKN